MKWRDDEATLEQAILSQRSGRDQDLEAMARLLVLRSAEGLTYEQVVKWRVSEFGRAMEEMIAALPKQDGLDGFRRSLGELP